MGSCTFRNDKWDYNNKTIRNVFHNKSVNDPDICDAHSFNCYLLFFAAAFQIMFIAHTIASEFILEMTLVSQD